MRAQRLGWLVSVLLGCGLLLAALLFSRFEGSGFRGSHDTVQVGSHHRHRTSAAMVPLRSGMLDFGHAEAK